MSDDILDSVKSNQFIRPKFDLVSAAERLALRGKDFANSAEFTDATAAGVGAELGTALMDALGDCFHACSTDDLCAITKLLYGRKGTPDKADAGTETPNNLADAKDEGNKFVRPQSSSEFLTFFKDFDKKQALGTKETAVVGKTVEPMLPKPVTSMVEEGGAKQDPTLYVGIWMNLPRIPLPKPTM